MLPYIPNRPRLQPDDPESTSFRRTINREIAVVLVVVFGCIFTLTLAGYFPGGTTILLLLCGMSGVLVYRLLSSTQRKIDAPLIYLMTMSIALAFTGFGNWGSMTDYLRGCLLLIIIYAHFRYHQWLGIYANHILSIVLVGGAVFCLVSIAMIDREEEAAQGAENATVFAARNMLAFRATVGAYRYFVGESDRILYKIRDGISNVETTDTKPVFGNFNIWIDSIVLTNEICNKHMLELLQKKVEIKELEKEIIPGDLRYNPEQTLLENIDKMYSLQQRKNTVVEGLSTFFEHLNTMDIDSRSFHNQVICFTDTILRLDSAIHALGQ